MSRSVNKVILIGTLGRDVELKYTASQKAVLKMSLATERRYKQGDELKKETDWHNIVYWGGENLVIYLLKGRQVYIEGRLQTRSWDDKDGNKRYSTEVVAENIVLLGGGGEQRQQQRAAAHEPDVISDEDVPF